MSIIDQVFWWVGVIICACGVAVFVYYCAYFCLKLCRLISMRETLHYIRQYIHLYIRFRRFVQSRPVCANDICPHCKGSGVTEVYSDLLIDNINKDLGE